MNNEEYNSIKRRVERGEKITPQEKEQLEKLVNEYHNIVIDLTNRGDIKQALYMTDAKNKVIKVIEKGEQ